MSTVNLVPNGVVLADHDLNHSFEKWRSQVDSSGFYIAVETDDQGHCLSVLASHSPALEGHLWTCLPLVAHDPVRAILSAPAADIRHRTLHVACLDSENRWLECCAHYFKSATGESRCLLLIRQTTHETPSATDFQQERLRAIAYERIKFSLLELILKEQDALRILEKIVHDIESIHTEVYCAIVLTRNLGKLVQTVIASSLPQAMLQTLRQLQLDTGNGSLATSIATKQRVVVENVMTHPYWLNHREAARASGIQAGWSEPILSAEGEVLGAFAMYYRQPQTPSAFELSMIEQAAKLVSIVVDRHLSQESIQSLAYYEPVTGLPNRRKVYEHLHQLRKEATHGQWGMIYIDLDHFKWVNEAHGHTTGNQLLHQVAERLQKAAEPHFIACMGGDEFVVLLSGLASHADEAAEQMWHMQRQLQKVFQRPFKIGAQKLSITASMGLCSFNETDPGETDYVKAADIAMHKAKQAGRNQACLYEPGMQTEIATKVMLEADLREAIAQQQLRLYYQVQVDHTGRPFGAEVLLRWHHPQRGVISPLAFISVAENSGLIVEMGQWVLDQACAQIACWQQSLNTRELSLSVNISARQFRQADFVDMVKACIQRHQINPNALRLELTESLLLENVDDAVLIMEELSQLGIQFSLDDFGTGYSSLQYLKKLPLYQLKIDRSFVHDLVTDSHDRTIVRTIIAMAQSMYLNVIAEGVETQAQLELLSNNGCRRYQGFLFGKPMPIEAFSEWLQERLT
jgi:diguanylate cyclase (GGDEF)-like protein